MSADPTHTTLSTACWNSDHHPDRCAESLADGDVCDCRCHTSNPATAAPSGPATFQECIAAWPQATDCTDNPEWGTHMCDEVVDHAGDHVCTCGQHVPQCRAEYAPERRDPTARIVACSLARGHNGDHTELFTEATWPQTAAPGTAAPATPPTLYAVLDVADSDAICVDPSAALELADELTNEEDSTGTYRAYRLDPLDNPATAAPPTPGQLDIDAIEHRAHLYSLLTHQIGDDGSVDLSRAAQRSADDVPGLLAELRDLSGDLIEQGDRLRETLLKRDELRERLELAEEASDRLRAELVEVTTERDHLRQYAETVRHHQQSSSEGWREVERLRGELERANGAAPGVWQLPAELRGDSPCGDCGTLDNIVWFAESVFWNRVMGGPEATGDPGGIVCIPCFVRRVHAAELYPTGWRLLPDFHWETVTEREARRGPLSTTPPAGTEGEHADQG